MNANDVLFYGHRTFTTALESVPQSTWHQPGVCGVWSVKDIVAHLASHEQLLVDVLNTFLQSDAATPMLETYMAIGDQFNDLEVEKRRDKNNGEVQAEYNDAHAKTLELIAKIPEAKRREKGTMPWYGDVYDLEDFIAYGFYGHKREHSAQIAVYADQLARAGGQAQAG